MGLSATDAWAKPLPMIVIQYTVSQEGSGFSFCYAAVRRGARCFIVRPNDQALAFVVAHKTGRPQAAPSR
jgi:hypothetical protein